MDVLFNENSLNGQFHSEEEFFDYLRSEILHCFKEMDRFHLRLYSSYQAFQHMVTYNLALHDLLNNPHPSIISLKHLWVQLNAGPYREDNAKTRKDVQYISKIAEIPNCITEAYERSGIVFSFKRGGFDEKELGLTRNCVECMVSNFTCQKYLNDHMIEKGIKWKKNSFEVKELEMKFEIRSNEPEHHEAHFHLSKSDGSESIVMGIPDLNVLEGKCSHINQIREWAQNNQSLIIDLWNRHHPNRLVKS